MRRDKGSKSILKQSIKQGQEHVKMDCGMLQTHHLQRIHRAIVQPSLSSQHMCPHTLVGAWWKTQKPFTLLESAPEANLAANPTFVQLADANIQHIVRGSALGVHHL